MSYLAIYNLPSIGIKQVIHCIQLWLSSYPVDSGKLHLARLPQARDLAEDPGGILATEDRGQQAQGPSRKSRSA